MDGLIMGRALKIVGAFLLVAVVFILTSCYTHEVDTVSEWCEQIAGVDLAEKHRPWWAVIFGVSFDGDKIRDDHATYLNSWYMEIVRNRARRMEIVQNRGRRMVWREGTDLHMVNLASLLQIDPEKFIAEWRDRIEKAKHFAHTDRGSECLFGTVVSLFDNLHIHLLKIDVLGVVQKDSVTTISMEREERLGKGPLKPL